MQVASEVYLRSLAKVITGESMATEIGAFTFHIWGGEEIHRALFAYVSNLKLKVARGIYLPHGRGGEEIRCVPFAYVPNLKVKWLTW